jgi:serine/threonine-protein kinase
MAAAGSGAYFTVHMLIRSEDRVVVPDLVNKDVVYALEVLSDLGLNTKIKGTEFHRSVPKHSIINQSPDPGTD